MIKSVASAAMLVGVILLATLVAATVLRLYGLAYCFRVRRAHVRGARVGPARVRPYPAGPRWRR